MKLNIRKYINDYYEFWFALNCQYEHWARGKGLTFNSLLVLDTIAEHVEKGAKCTQKLICERLFLPKQTVGTILDSFEKKGYLERVTVPEDRRNKSVLLTEAGRKWADEILEELYRTEREALLGMTEEQRAAMLDTSRLFLGNFTHAVRSRACCAETTAADGEEEASC